MDIILDIAMFIMGTVLGSFFTLAVYRIPLKKDITHERSFCPNCNHRLEFLDLIPVLSYIFLGGKCRYCKQKIRPRYLLLEVFSGIIFMLFYISLKINIFALDVQKLVYLVFGIFYISTLFIIGGIEKEKHYISNSVLIFGLVISAIYIIYLYIIHVSIYKYVIYFVFMFVFIILNELQKIKDSVGVGVHDDPHNPKNYTAQILALTMFLAIGTTEKNTVLEIIVTLLLFATTKIINHKKENKQVPIGFYLCTVNVALLILTNFIAQN